LKQLHHPPQHQLQLQPFKVPKEHQQEQESIQFENQNPFDASGLEDHLMIFEPDFFGEVQPILPTQKNEGDFVNDSSMLIIEEAP
jgi:hypothetical protein